MTASPGADARPLGLARLARTGNPYLDLLEEQLTALCFTVVPDPPFTLRWLWQARGNLRFLHFHWRPDLYYVWPGPFYRTRRRRKLVRFQRALTWVTLTRLVARVLGARVLGYRIVWTIHEVLPPETRPRLVGHGADAASMVEPFATALEEQAVGWVASRTGDVWPGAPGCSLTTTRRLLDERPDVVERVVSAFVEGADFVERHPAEAAAIAEPYIGVGRRLIEKALARNRPSVHALSNADSMEAILDLDGRARLHRPTAQRIRRPDCVARGHRSAESRLTLGRDRVRG